MGVVAWGGIIIASSLDNNPKRKKKTRAKVRRVGDAP